MSQVNDVVLNGSSLILSLGENALGYSSGCKISTTTETAERVTKEAPDGRWKEKYVKSFSETITADGIVLLGGGDDKPTYDELKAKQLAGEPITLKYNVREGDSREGKAAGGYTGQYLITSLDLDGQAAEDAKYSATFENCGAVSKVANGLGPAA